MTVDEWMTVGGGTATWVREMILQSETADVSDLYTGLHSSYSITGVVK
jgi:hypothetical protein